MQEIEKIYLPDVFGENGVVGECGQPQAVKPRCTQFLGELITSVEREFGTRPY